MRKVLLGTPCYDGKVVVEFLQSIIGTMALAAKQDIAIFPVQIKHDALVQRARNDLVKMALETNCDDLMFVDADQEWNPEWIFRLLNHSVDVVGGAVPKKSDVEIDFNIKLMPEGVYAPVNHLMQVAAVGTGFLRVSRKALQAVWDISEVFTDGRMVFDVKLIDGELVSEDNVFCAKWRSLGGQVWVDPSMTCNHIGEKIYRGDFAAFIQNFARMPIEKL
ncbi:MAG: hypothetical protein A2143_00780 [Gallionellales bacterium RBG_16_57_15]|nr:MAG: hypothetical protein A2143_00780 [Gallionellales bacterium RBG_16_57_15]